MYMMNGLLRWASLVNKDMIAEHSLTSCNKSLITGDTDILFIEVREVYMIDVLYINKWLQTDYLTHQITRKLTIHFHSTQD